MLKYLLVALLILVPTIAFAGIFQWRPLQRLGGAVRGVFQNQPVRKVLGRVGSVRPVRGLFGGRLNNRLNDCN